MLYQLSTQPSCPCLQAMTGGLTRPASRNKCMRQLHFAFGLICVLQAGGPVCIPLQVVGEHLILHSLAAKLGRLRSTIKRMRSETHAQDFILLLQVSNLPHFRQASCLRSRSSVRDLHASSLIAQASQLVNADDWCNWRIACRHQ